MVRINACFLRALFKIVLRARKGPRNCPHLNHSKNEPILKLQLRKVKPCKFKSILKEN